MVAYFGDLHAMGLQFDDYTASSRRLTAANWGGIAPLEPRHAACTMTDSS